MFIRIVAPCVVAGLMGCGEVGKCAQPMLQPVGASCCWEYGEQACGSGAACLVTAQGEPACTPAGSGAASLPKWQGLYQRCDAAYGADSCAAGLLCSHLPGMTADTCMIPFSIGDMQPCVEDRQCMSKVCNRAEAGCKSATYGPCLQRVGCVSALVSCGADQASPSGYACR